jgi:hypothetical protein
MSNQPTKVVCEARRCGWHGMDDKALRAPSPFSDDILIACPKCKEVGSLIVACDETECWKEATCGTPTADDYRMTCFDHRPIDDGETKCAS